MTITLNTTFFIIFSIIIIVVLYFIIAYILVKHRYKKLLEEYSIEKRNYLRKVNQVSMIEYHFREYKEGKNPFTVLRDIGEIIYIGVEVFKDGK